MSNQLRYSRNVPLPVAGPVFLIRVSSTLDIRWMTSKLDTMVEDAVITNNVRERRASVGLSQAALAEALHVSRQTVNAIETGRYMPSLPLAIALARFFGARVEEVFHVNETTP